MVWIAILFSLIVPGIAFAVIQRKKEPEESLPWRGFFAGLLPMLVAAAWAVFFIVHYWKSYDYNGMQLMNGYKMLFYVCVSVTVPLSANLVWKKTPAPLMKKRFLLSGLFVLSCVLNEYIPVGWSFTFVLVPFAFFVVLIGFAFLRRTRLSGSC